jgi:zinc transport system substrate-binding protein
MTHIIYDALLSSIMPAKAGTQEKTKPLRGPFFSSFKLISSMDCMLSWGPAFDGMTEWVDRKVTRFLRLLGSLLVSLFIFCTPSHAKQLNILVTITPIYSLVKNVTGNLQNVQLLIDKNMCPHDYQLRPSDVRKINKADMLITVGDGFETFLFNYINKSSVKINTISLINTPGLTLLHMKKESLSEDGHAQCNHNHSHGHNHSHQHDHHDDLMHYDWNLWPSVKNAKAIIQWLTSELAAKDPENAQKYLENSERTLAKLSALDLKMKAKLTPVQHQNFIVLNDDYQYLEQEYGLSNVGTVKIDNNLGYSAKKLKDIQGIVQEKQPKCIFAEAHTPKSLMDKIAHITGVKVGYIDIEWGIGNKQISDKDAYFYMMKKVAQDIARCLKQ